MSKEQVTLNHFFSSQTQLSTRSFSPVESCEKMLSVKRLLLQQAGVTWPLVLDTFLEKTRDILNIDIPDIMTAAWNKYKILLKYKDKEKYPPDDTFLVHLAEHTFRSMHQPFIEIRVNDQLVDTIDFEIALSLTLKGIALKIRDGKIREISAGECKGKGSVHCENRLILEKETKSFTLPGTISLGDGVPIVG
ncbi:MAG: hypothetical protein JXA46_10530 [Dehalococcoidales bacterium]|nr:hypothetical protein [Dehalococcoidales bacterium]